MARLLHPTERGGGITILSTRYPIDAQGGIVVSDPGHISILKQIGCKMANGASPPVSSPALTPVDPEVPELATTENPAPIEPDRFTKNDLLEQAEALGLDVDRRTSKLKLIAAIRAAREG